MAFRDEQAWLGVPSFCVTALVFALADTADGLPQARLSSSIAQPLA